MTEQYEVLMDDDLMNEAIKKMKIAKGLLRDLANLVHENSTITGKDENNNRIFKASITMGQITKILEKHDTLIMLAMIGSGAINESSSPIHKEIITAMCHVLAEREMSWKKILTQH